MDTIRSLIVNHTKESFNISADKELYARIMEDMLENAGPFVPRSAWQELAHANDCSKVSESLEDKELSDAQMRANAEAMLTRFPSLPELLDSFIGPIGIREQLDPSTISGFREYMQGVDTCGFFAKFIESDTYRLSADMTTAVEAAIFHLLLKEKKTARILEIGGGYGRLCEGIMNLYGDQVTYLLADSVPISLMYCYLFLRKNLPELRIGIYYYDQHPDLDAYDCFVVPTWRIEELTKNTDPFDLAVNIQSMQEMRQWHVDYYLNLFDQALKKDGFIYLNNNKRYIFQGQWNYPKNWKLITRHPTPWGWSPDHPTEIFQKTSENQEPSTSLENYVYRKYVEKVDALAAGQSALKQETDRKDALQQQRDALQQQKDALQQQRDTLQSQKDTLQKQCNDLQEQKHTLEEQRDALQQQGTALRQQRDALQQKTATLQEERELLHKKMVSGALELEETRKVLFAMEHSTCWRLTKPLRALLDALRK